MVPCGFIVTVELASPIFFHLCFPLLIILTQTSIFDVLGILFPPLHVNIKLSRFYISVTPNCSNDLYSYGVYYNNLIRLPSEYLFLYKTTLDLKFELHLNY